MAYSLNETNSVPVEPFQRRLSLLERQGVDAYVVALRLDWFDHVYDGPSTGTEVQDNLREWADKVEAES